MNIEKYLNIAGVPKELHASAIESIESAQARAGGLTLAKWKVRLFKAGKIADMLEWEDERLRDKHPELADWDIAPMLNITAHGDNVPWPNGRPAPGAWLADTPEAVAANYWCKGVHPRSKRSRKAWYRRNAGEHKAWRLGAPVALEMEHGRWERTEGRTKVIVQRCGPAWIIRASWKLIGSININTRIGFEVDNVFDPVKRVQLWYPIEGCELRAPVTWSILPGRRN